MKQSYPLMLRLGIYSQLILLTSSVLNAFAYPFGGRIEFATLTILASILILPPCWHTYLIVEKQEKENMRKELEDNIRKELEEKIRKEFEEEMEEN